MMDRVIATRRASAIIIFFGLVVTPVFFMVYGIAGYLFVTLDAIRNSTITLHHYQNEIAEQPLVKRSVQSIRTDLSGANVFYGEQTTAAASARFGQGLKDIVQASGGYLRSLTIAPNSKNGQLEVLEVSVDATIPSSRLPSLLSSIQHQRPFMIINSISLTGGPSSIAQEQLWLAMTVTALRRPRDAAH